MMTACLSVLLATLAPVHRAQLDPKVALKNGAVPASLRASFSARGHTLRFARAPIGPRGTRALLHFYRPRSRRKSSLVEGPVALDVYMPRGRKPVRVAAVPLGSLQEFSWRDAELRWLQPGKRSGPIVLVPIPSGARLVVFPSGWRGRRFVQDFEGSASSITEFHHEFNSVDGRGFFMVQELHSERPEGDEPAPTTTLELVWNGKQFAPRRG